jgi:hypothetical protein
VTAACVDAEEEMLLPNRKNAYIPPEKLTGYLLSETHVVGKTKARFFRAYGYNDDNVHLLEQGLLQIARNNEIAEETTSPHGTGVQGTLSTPRGPVVIVHTVWIIEPEDERPRFVTAYPR